MNDIEPSDPLRIQNKLSIYNVLERRLLRVASEKEVQRGRADIGSPISETPHRRLLDSANQKRK